MTHTHERTGNVAREPQPPAESIVAITTESGVIIYDRRDPAAWISSTAARAVPETR